MKPPTQPAAPFDHDVAETALQALDDTNVDALPHTELYDLYRTLIELCGHVALACAHGVVSDSTRDAYLWRAKALQLRLEQSFNARIQPT